MKPANLHIAWAELLIDSLVESGVTDAIVSPGSRNTPLLIAALRNDHLEVRAVIDERSAAFFALGRAKMTGLPPLLICTSGTAGAHYYPALIEASKTHTPLLVLTADRPPELHGNAAPQTADQNHLYGNYVRAFIDIGMPDDHDDALAGLRRRAAQAFAASLGPIPGPVHLNAPFRKPLEPKDRNDADKELATRIRSLRARPLPQPEGDADHAGTSASRAAIANPPPRTLARFIDACSKSRRGVIVCGPRANGPAAMNDRLAIQLFAERAGFPLLAEATSQVRFTGAAEDFRADSFDLFLRSPRFLEGHAPDLIIQFGSTPASKGWEVFLERHTGTRCTGGSAPPVPHWVITPHGWNDAQNSATDFLRAEPGPVAAAAADQLGEKDPAATASWREEFRAADQVTQSVIAAHFEESGELLSEGKLARTLIENLPRKSLLAVGNSLPVRNLDIWAPGERANLTVWSQRGVNGIDGLISGAAGAASAFDGPAVLYLGDVSFLHDLPGLALAGRTGHPFVIVIAQNGGGRIFDLLPLDSDSLPNKKDMDIWTTPHSLGFLHAANLFGHHSFHIKSRQGLRSSLADGLERKGCTVIEATIQRGEGAGEGTGGPAGELRKVRAKLDGTLCIST